VGLLFLRINRALQFVFLSLTILFFLLAARDYLGSATIGTLAGYEGIICGLSAGYTGLAQCKKTMKSWGSNRGISSIFLSAKLQKKIKKIDCQFSSNLCRRREDVSFRARDSHGT
jgi:hypothetical protein